MNMFHHKTILKMLFLAPRRVPSHKGHSQGSNGSKKERKSDSFFNLLSMVLLAFLGLSHFSLFSCLLLGIAPGNLFLLFFWVSCPAQTNTEQSQHHSPLNLTSCYRVRSPICDFTSKFRCLFSEGLLCDETWGSRVCLKAHSSLQPIQNTSCFPK